MALTKNDPMRKLQELSPQIEKRIENSVALRDEIRKCQETFERTEALAIARVLALTSMPIKRTKELRRSKVLRLGSDLWAKVFLSSVKGEELPFGDDRFVLAAIQHLAIENDNPIVLFEEASQLLKMFDVNPDGKGYSRLRERFRRLSDLAISIQFGDSREKVDQGNLGENLFVIETYFLPSRDELKKEITGQLRLKEVTSPYGVKLGDKFWKHLREKSNHLLVPLQLLKNFMNRPVGWDYATYLVYRCGAAKKTSIIEHETLMDLFKEGKEEDRQTIARLKKYHSEVMFSTNNSLDAEIIENYYPPKGRGRRKKRWILRVGPSKPIIFSGKKPGQLNVDKKFIL